MDRLQSEKIMNQAMILYYRQTDRQTDKKTIKLKYGHASIRGDNESGCEYKCIQNPFLMVVHNALTVMFIYC
jgi:hypothetical protein